MELVLLLVFIAIIAAVSAIAAVVAMVVLAATLATAVFIGLIVASITAFIIWRQWFETYHLATVDDRKLYRDGNRGMREFSNMLRSVQPRTVVGLLEDSEWLNPKKPEFAAEMELLRSRPDIRFEKVPIPLGGWPDDAAIARFLLIATDPARQPVVVHCAQGVRRTGMMVAAYQMSVLGFSKDRARKEVLAFGHSMQTIADVRRFIDVYDPATRRMTEALPQSKE